MHTVTIKTVLEITPFIRYTTQDGYHYCYNVSDLNKVLRLLNARGIDKVEYREVWKAAGMSKTTDWVEIETKLAEV